VSELLFRTPVESVSIPSGASKQLGIVDVSVYSKIQ
jgi:hypothetical protein